ncbi:MAG: hypothetical protein ACI9H8_002147, partial [Lysobacterales bacterium]
MIQETNTGHPPQIYQIFNEVSSEERNGKRSKNSHLAAQSFERNLLEN